MEISFATKCDKRQGWQRSEVKTILVMSNCIQVTAVFVLVTPFYMQLEQLHIEAHTKVEIFTHELYNYLNSSTFFFLRSTPVSFRTAHNASPTRMSRPKTAAAVLGRTTE